MGRRFKFKLLKELMGEKDEEMLPFTYNKYKLKQTETDKLNRLAKHKKSFFGGFRYTNIGRSYYNSQSKEHKQLCIFKSKYRFNKALNLKHLAYIQREGKGLDNSTPVLYGADPEHYEEKAGN